MSNKTYHYNQFLLHLDKQQQQQQQQQQQKDQKDQENENQEKEGKEEQKVENDSIKMEEYIKQIEQIYQSNYNTTTFSGYCEEDTRSTYNPNLYNADELRPINKSIDPLIPIWDYLSANSYPFIFNPLQKSSLKNHLIQNINRKTNNNSQEYERNKGQVNHNTIGKVKTKEERENPKEERENPKEERENPKEEREKTKMVTIYLDQEVNTVDDILSLIKTYPMDHDVTYNLNLKGLHNIRDELEQLNNVIGMNSLKKDIVEQLIYFIQEFYKKQEGKESIEKNQDYLHTVIYGPPGTGKTEIAKLMGKIYSKIGILSKGTFKKVTRSDLIAGYLGQTAIKTKDVIRDSLGGVLFIDEAYALGNSEKRDSFSKECIDTLCEALSDNKDNWMVIIAGYEEEIRDCFFSYNQGLESRFTWRFQTEKYGAEDLYLIFLKKVKDIGWSISEEKNNSSSQKKITIDWFERNKDAFPFYGRDIETFLSRVKIAHSKRVFGKEEIERRQISYQDMEKGLTQFLKHKDEKKREEEKERKRIRESIYI